MTTWSRLQVQFNWKLFQLPESLQPGADSMSRKFWAGFFGEIFTNLSNINRMLRHYVACY